MRILGIETSSRRGSIALVEQGRPVYAAEYEAPTGHAERLLPLLEKVLAETGLSRKALDLIAVGVGPGSFTGLRAGIAFAQGLALGLAKPLAGVCSLQAMARGVPAELGGDRCPVLDARREELFVALYGPAGAERAAPIAVRKDEAAAWVARATSGPVVLCGEGAAEIPGAAPYRASDTDLPHATFTALCAASWRPPYRAAEPLYIRPVDAIRPNLPPSPLSSEPKS